MYVTRPRSLYKRDPTALSVPTPEGPYSGYLVIQDEEAQSYCCFGMYKNSTISHTPFPQNMNSTISYYQSTGNGVIVLQDKIIFIPVLNHPLSANRYYVINRRGKHQGEASTSSKAEEKGTFMCCRYIKDVKPKPLDPFNELQMFEIRRKTCGFSAKSVAEDSFPPYFLRRNGWNVSTTTPRHYHLDEALGLNSSLRARLPDFDFSLLKDCSEPVAVGEWYVPFMFVKEEMKLSDQMEKSVYYRMTLLQRWEKIFSKENNNGEGNEVSVDVDVATEIVKVGGTGKEAVFGEGDVDGDGDRVLWFNSKGGEAKVGLSLAVYEQMKWEQNRGGWVRRQERQVRLEREEKFEGSFGWKNFGCYMLVESFVLKRMDESLVLSYDFRHTHLIRCKWE